MQTELLLRIAGVGVLTWAIAAILRQAGRDELATLSTVAGVVIVLLLVIDVVSQLLNQVQTIFGLY